MNIQHSPLFNTKKAEELYTEKDGVEVKYVCTTDLRNSDIPADIFYRETPHPEFGNYYFGLLRHNDQTLVTDADIVESFDFGMIESKGKYYYSQHRHDYKVIDDKMIDGGRAYIRSGAHDVDVFKIQDGEFVRYESSE
jgi:hypothetical protein